MDLFFRSLADTHGPHAAPSIVLGGADGDGALSCEVANCHQEREQLIQTTIQEFTFAANVHEWGT